MAKNKKIKNSINPNFELILEKFSIGETITRDELIQIVDYLHGIHLNLFFLKEWEIINQIEKNDLFEEEHAESLALIFENETQKLQLEELNKKLSESIRINDRDMKMAAKVQRSLLFDKPPHTNNFDIAFHYEPFASVSGDFYDFYVDDKNQLIGSVLADVSGHGIASSLLTAIAKPIFFRLFRSNKDKILDKAVHTINKQLIQDIEGSDNYLTAAILRFNNDNVEYVSAAHPDIIHKSWNSNDCKYVRSDERSMKSSILGLSSVDIPFQSHEFKISSNDLLIIFSDCLTESKNHRGIEFGEQTLLNIIDQVDINASSQKVIDDILTYFRAHVDFKPLNDDLTIIVIKKK